MKILYLYAELMGYTIATIRALSENSNEVHVVHWDHKKLTPYSIPLIPNVYFYSRSQLTVEQIAKMAIEIGPAVTVVSGWMDKGYIAVARKLIQERRQVVLGLDGHWKASLKQCFAAVMGKIGFISLFYSHVWVAGALQFEYACRLGFNKSQIIFDLYSADTRLFELGFIDNHRNKQNRYPHRFLFVGRLEPIKGLNVLIEAWDELAGDRLDWELHLIGNGSLRGKIPARPGLLVRQFMQPEILVKEVANAGCFVLPSLDEPWGVVIHEFAAAGLPLIVSESVGSASTFLISGLNGYRFNANSSTQLTTRLRKIINMTDSELQEMSIWSNCLSKRITPQTSANNLLGLIK
jgi:glycosyltransferase involved in cell wall biosynthesis